MFETVKTGPNAGNLVYLDIGPTAIKENRLWWQKEGLSYTASGYGKKIPTRWMVRTIDNRWRRVYCCIYSNNGSLYVMHGKNKTLVNLQGV